MGGSVSSWLVSGGCVGVVSGGFVGVVSGGVVGFVSSGGVVGVVGFSVACGEVGLGSVEVVPSGGPAGSVPSVLFSVESGTEGFVDVGSDVTGPGRVPSWASVGSVWEDAPSEGAPCCRSGPLEAVGSESGAVQPTSTKLIRRMIAMSFFMGTLPFVMGSLLLHE